MTPEMILDFAKLAISTLLVVISPIMVVALVVGLAVSLFQALTSIQEMTLTFVPKILAVFLVLMLIMPWMADRINTMTLELFDAIAKIGVATTDE
ncbi:MAG: flagellar biosynthesis protein FliQ [Proteobacteria bacterium]|nr:flagellar biosynthesis protein FliQ [Pseudomonadota bacterium]